MAGELSVSQEDRERAMLRSRKMFLTDMQSNLATAEDRGFAKGFAKGFAEGFAEGLAESRAEGFTEGFAESRAETMVASIKKVMDNLNLSMEQAMAALNLSQEERLKYKALLNG